MFTDTTIKFSETTETDNGQVINPHTSYRADVYTVDAVVYHALATTANVIYAWPRPSSSFTARMFDDSSYVEPHKKDSIISYSNTSANLTGFVYKLKDMSGNFIGWYPADTNATLEYSMLMYDSTLTTGIYETQMQELGITLYPNPALEGHTMVVNADKDGDEIEMKLYDIQGKVLNSYTQKDLQQGRNVFSFDLSALSSGIYFYKVIMNNTTRSVKFNKL